MKNIILIAPQAAGKGTQSALIREKYGIPHISVGDLLRSARSNETEIGRKIIDYQDKGILVPQEIVSQILEDRLNMDDCQNGFILDGYPRNMIQAEAFDEYLKKTNKEINYVIYLNISKEEVLSRITGRRICSSCGANYNINYTSQSPNVNMVCDKCNGTLIQRSDDTEEAINKRLEIYYNDTEPLLDLYKNKNILYDIDGTKAPEEVFNEIEKIFEENE